MSEWVITSSILILLVIGIRACFRNKIALWARYALWLVVALRLLVPLSFSESSFSVLNFLNRESDGRAEAAAEADETAGRKIAPAEEKLPEVFSGMKEEGGGANADGDGFRAMDSENIGRPAQETGVISTEEGKSGNMTDARNGDQ